MLPVCRNVSRQLLLPDHCDQERLLRFASKFRSLQHYFVFFNIRFLPIQHSMIAFHSGHQVFASTLSAELGKKLATSFIPCIHHIVLNVDISELGPRSNDVVLQFLNLNLDLAALVQVVHHLPLDRLVACGYSGSTLTVKLLHVSTDGSVAAFDNGHQFTVSVAQRDQDHRQLSVHLRRGCCTGLSPCR